MKIKSFFKKNLIFLDQNFSSQKDALEFFANALEANNYAKNGKKVYKLFDEREKQVSTGIGDAIAIPHLRDEVMNQSVLMFARVKDLNWNSLDGKDVNYIFAIAMSKEEGANSHLDVISKLSKLLMNKEFVDNLSKVKSEKEFLELVDKFETEIDIMENTSQNEKGTIYEVVAVTACPTGIAHTYLAEQRLKEAAKAMNINIKVETQGADGPKNVLTEEDIKNAKGVILAIDREIEKARFANLENVLEIPTKKAIHNGKDQIQDVLDNKGTKLKAVSAKENESLESNMSFEGFGKRMYRSMMTGISYMLPFVIFGGIMIALAFIIDMIMGSIAGTANDKTWLSSFGSNASGAAWFMSLGGIAMKLAVPILAAYIAFAIVGRQGLLPGFVVGSIASGVMAGSYKFLEPTLNASASIEASKFLETGSGFIGAILGGFFAAAMVIVFSKYAFGKTPKSMQGTKNILLIPLLCTLATGAIFWVVNILFIYMNYGLTFFLSLMQDKPYLAWLLGLILGAMMAVDLGGPINKAAYVFGTMTIANGNSSIAMAAVMAAGMVPPLGISLSMFINKKLWSKEDIEAGRISNILFGISFISEGAIPYTSKNPKVMIPSNIIGGAVAGLTSAALGVTIIAPHGGVFVSFLAKCQYFAGNFGLEIGMGIVFWFLAILAGTAASALSIWAFSKICAKKGNVVKA